MHSGSDGKKKKRAYIPPAITKLPLDKAKQFIIERTHCTDQEAMDLLGSMHGELRRKAQSVKPSVDDNRNRSA
jgi:hypothetical protein